MLKKRIAAGLAAFSLVGGGVGLLNAAHAAPVSTVQASWTDGVPDTIKNGELASFNFQVNANDDKGLTGTWNDLTTKITLTNAVWASIPDSCNGTNTNLSQDRKTLTCDLGNVPYGTAITVPGSIMAQGADGDVINVQVDGEQNSVTLPPKNISAFPGVDVFMNGTYEAWPGYGAKLQVHVPVGITIPVGAENIQDNVSFDVTVSNAMSGAAATDVLTPVGCQQTMQGTGSPTPLNDPNTYPQPLNCTITKIDNSHYHVDMSGFRTFYSPQPKTDQKGNPLAPDRVWITGTDLVFTDNGQALSIDSSTFQAQFAASNVQATTLSGKQASDVDTTNQESAYGAYAGSEASNFNRYDSFNNTNATFQVGAPWDAKSYVLAGDTVWGYSGQTTYTNAVASTPTPIGNCVIIDTKASTYDASLKPATWTGGAPNVVEYSTTPVSDPVNQRCNDSMSWSTNLPSDPTTITAVRVTWDASQQDPNSPDFNATGALDIPLKINQNLQPGDDVWEFGSVNSAGYWKTSEEGVTLEPTPGLRYPYTTNYRDVLRITSTRTSSNKTVDKQNVKVGETATYTVSGSLNNSTGTTGSGTIDMVDTLDNGLQYTNGSASVQPTNVTNNPDGTTTLTWNNVPVTFNTPEKITYQAVPTKDGIENNNLDVTNTTNNADPTESFNKSHSSASVTAQSDGKTVLTKTVTSKEFAVDGSNTWKLDLTNNDGRTQDQYDILDILPYNGDGRTTSFVGTYSVDNVTAPAGATVYYTTTPSAQLKGDPADPSNGSFANPSAIWTTTKPADGKTITGVRIIGTNLAPAADASATIDWSTQNAASDNVYDNIAYSRATTTELQMVKSESTTVLKEGSRLQIDKSLDPNQVPVKNGTLTYTVTALNSGQGTAHDVEVTDLPSANLLKNVTLSSPSVGTINGNNWEIGDLAPNTPVTVKVSATVDPNADLNVETVNTVRIHNPSNPDTPTCVENVTVQSDTDQCDVVSKKEVSNLRVHKEEVDKHLTTDGKGYVTYKVIAHNDGPDAAPNVVVTDIPGYGLDPNGGKTWNIPLLQPNQDQEFTITVPVVAVDKPVENQVTISNDVHPKDSNSCNPNSTVLLDTDQCDKTSTSENSNLKVHKEVEAKQLTTDGKGFVTYKVIAHNDGPDTAYNVKVNDIPGYGLDPKGAKTWTIDALEPNKDQTFDITVPVVAVDKPVVNNVTISSDVHPLKGTPDTTCVPNSDVASDTDQCDSVPVTENSILKVDKSTDNVIDQNGVITYTVTARNDGTDPAFNVVVNDVKGYGLLNVTPSSFNIPVLQPGEEKTFTVKGQIDQRVVLENKAIVNNVTIENDVHKDHGIPGKNCVVNDNVKDDTDQCDSVDVTPSPNPLKVDKKTDATKVHPGDPINYTLTVKNTGSIDLSNVTVTDTMVKNLDSNSFKFDSTDPDVKVDNAKGTWSIPVLKAQDTLTINVSAKVSDNAKAGDLVSNAVVVSNPNYPKDPYNPTVECKANDNVDQDDDQCDIVNTPIVDPVLQLDKEVVSNTVNGNTATTHWKITVLNTKNTNKGVVVKETLPQGIDPNVVTEVSKGSYDKATNVWTIGDMAENESVTMDITTTSAVSDKVLYNQASVSSPYNPETGSCKPNNSVQEDDDQCDIVSVVLNAPVNNPPVVVTTPPAAIKSGEASTGISPELIGVGLLMMTVGGSALIAKGKKH